MKVNSHRNISGGYHATSNTGSSQTISAHNIKHPGATNTFTRSSSGGNPQQLSYVRTSSNKLAADPRFIASSQVSTADHHTNVGNHKQRLAVLRSKASVKSGHSSHSQETSAINNHRFSNSMTGGHLVKS